MIIIIALPSYIIRERGGREEGGRETDAGGKRWEEKEIRVGDRVRIPTFMYMYEIA